MGFKDDDDNYTYGDDDDSDFLDADNRTRRYDDDADDEEDESLGARPASSGGSNPFGVKPFSGGGLPGAGQSRFGSGSGTPASSSGSGSGTAASGSGSTSPFSRSPSSSGTPPASGTPPRYGSGSGAPSSGGSTGSSSVFGSGSSSSSTPPRIPASGAGSSSSSGSSGAFSSGSSSSSTPSRFPPSGGGSSSSTPPQNRPPGSSGSGSSSSPFGSGGSGSSSGAFSSSSSSGQPNRPAGGSGSGSGSSSGGFGSGSSSGQPNRPGGGTGALGSGSSSSSTPNRPESSTSSPSNPADKNAPKEESKSRFGISNPFAKKDDKAEPARLGNLAGGKDAPKKDTPENARGGGMLSGLTSRLPGAAKPAADAPAKKPADKDGKPPEKGGGFLSGLTSRLPVIGAKTDAKEDKSSGGIPPRPGTTGSGAGAQSPAFGSASGVRPTGNLPAVSAGGGTAAAKPAGFAGRPGATDTKDTKKGSTAAALANPGIGGRIGAFFRRDAAAPKPPARAKTSKAPTVTSEEGLTLDNWLDIAGVSLVFSALVLIFSAFSSEQAAIGGLLRFIGELFGWGGMIVPATMLAIGCWLIVRHFGDTAPSIDPIRVIGIVLVFITLLIIFQYIHSLNYANIVTTTDLEVRLKYAWDTERAGGGALGAALYFFLIRNVTEIGGIFVIVLVLVVAAMLITRSSASGMLTTSVGVGRSARESLQRRASVERARVAIEREAREARLAQQMAAQAIANPMATPAQVFAAAADPSIRINRGGANTTPLAASAPALMLPPIPMPLAPAAQPQASVSLLGRISPSLPGTAVGNLFRRSPAAEAAPPPIITPLPLDDMPLPAPATGAFSMSNSRNGGSDEPPRAPMPAINPSAPAPLRPAALEESFSPYERPRAATSAAPIPSSPAYRFDDDTDEDDLPDALSERTDRLNALRAGNRPPAASPFTAQPTPFTPPSQLPSVQGNNLPVQQALSAPLNSGVIRPTKVVWKMPDFRSLLTSGSEQEFDRELLLKQAKIIEDTLSSFGAPGRVVEVNTGPVITQFGVEPDYVNTRGKKQRVKVGAIASLDKDLQLALGARSIRVEAPVPGKGYVGIEVPNKEPATVRLRDVMESPGFSKHKSPLAFALGQSVSGTPISADLASMPHILIAGTTGSGKSVCVNAIITSILALHTPDEVKFIMVDPKRVELTGYNGIPHLVAPVVVELERIVGVLKWVTREMDDRYKKFSDAGSRNITDYNTHLEEGRDRMAYIVVIIDELADLMMLAPEETERSITRIAALARATGIHLVLATQRPSVDVVTGLIKANFPARIAFAVAGGVDSRVILDQPGAEKLLGRGDMLYLSGDAPAPLRLQGVFVSDMEINNIVRYWKMQSVGVTVPQVNPLSLPATPIPPSTISLGALRLNNSPTTTTPAAQNAFWESTAVATPARAGSGLTEEMLSGDDGSEDDMYEQAVELVRRLDKASVSLLQRRLRIGYTRAARLIDMMEARQVVGPAKDGSSKPRDVIPIPGAPPKTS